MLSQEQGSMALILARDAISSQLFKRTLRISSVTKEKLNKKYPVFVTLTKDTQLRGAMGFNDSIYPLYEGVIKSAINSAFSDPRFPPLDKREFDMVSITVSVMTQPTLIEVRNPEDYINIIKIGSDGIMIISTFTSSILFPKTAIENNWSVEELLIEGCRSANLHPDSWQDFDACRVYRFQSQDFSEKKTSLTQKVITK